MDASAYFRDKKVTLMGLGLLGRGLGDARFLAESGADLIVTDLKSAEELTPSLEALREFKNIEYRLGEHVLEDFQGRDLILKAPKTPLDSPYIAEAKKQGTKISMSTALFASLARIPIVGVTGTRGKTTTTHMIAHILKMAGKEVLLGGNIQGVSTLALLPQVSDTIIAVLELDSWQLQGFREEGISPNVAVFTNLLSDHMDYYDGDMDAYLRDKTEIFLHQHEGDTLILGRDVATLLKSKNITSLVEAQVVDEQRISDWNISVLGDHNRGNAACAVSAVTALGISEEVSRRALESFQGVPGRLECIRELHGVKIYNDTTATTPDATIAALRAFGDKKNVVLLMGGSDKGLSMSALVDEISQRAKRVILLSGTGTNAILPLLPDASVYDSLSSAVAEAVRYAVPGDVVLFSPAFASFGMFTNEYQRGDAFTEAVRALS